VPFVTPNVQIEGRAAFGASLSNAVLGLVFKLKERGKFFIQHFILLEKPFFDLCLLVNI
jgi:hypothetical protein